MPQKKPSPILAVGSGIIVVVFVLAMLWLGISLIL